MLENLPENALTEKIIGCAIEVHRTYGGPGLREFAYEVALEWELRQAVLPSVRGAASGTALAPASQLGLTPSADMVNTERAEARWHGVLIEMRL